MSQKTARKSVVTEEKEKRQTDSPVKDMKKKVAANAEKEKHAAEKSVDKPDRPDKPIDKAEKQTDKPADKTDKTTEKTDKATDKATDKKTDKNEKKPDAAAEKKEENKEDKAGKSDAKPEAKAAKPKQNGNARVNGASSNGDHNGTVSPADDEDDDEGDDEMFPELTYDDTSDPEFEPDMPHGRSLTRRSQAKVTRTPETPRPASERAPEGNDDSKDSKVLKLKEDIPSTDRKLRSADSPKPEGKKQENKEKPQESGNKPQESANKPQESANKPQESANKPQESPKLNESGKKEESPKKPAKDKQREEKENGDGKMEVDIVVEIEDEEEPRKTDTNFSKSRVKVSPYRRSMRADQTASSTMANYTGNNTTMEMDITESSFVSTEASGLDDSSYLSGLRSIRGRRSYKPLKEMTLRQIDRSRASVSATEHTGRPTGTVVGRKRKPDADSSVEIATEASELAANKRMRLLDRLATTFRRTASTPLPARRNAELLRLNTALRKPDADSSIEIATEASELAANKRMRLLDRLATTFRRTASTPLPARRNAEIVGINTDLPLTAPVASTDTFDPETLKTTPAPPTVPISPVETDKDNKRCVIM